MHLSCNSFHQTLIKMLIDIHSNLAPKIVFVIFQVFLCTIYLSKRNSHNKIQFFTQNFSRIAINSYRKVEKHQNLT